MGSSSFFISTLRSHPGFGWKLTDANTSGNSTFTLVVDASSRSFGTRTTKRKNDPVGASLG
jgi:hypothetical protein